jgi:hypothetical protein
MARSLTPVACTAIAEVHCPSDTSMLPLSRSGTTSAALTDDSMVTFSPAAANRPRCCAMYRPVAPVAGTAATTTFLSARLAPEAEADADDVAWAAADGDEADELHAATGTTAAVSRISTQRAGRDT